MEYNDSKTKLFEYIAEIPNRDGFRASGFGCI